jgi:uncharacterized DUF497 family protein
MAESDDFAYEWDESKRRNTRKSRGIDCADMVLFDWDAALTRTDNRWDYARPGCPLLALSKIAFMFSSGVGVEML